MIHVNQCFSDKTLNDHIYFEKVVLTMKKASMIFLSFVLILSMLSTAACRSRLQEGIERDRKRYIVNEFSLEDAYSEEEGYHFPGLTWGDPISAVQEKLGVMITKVNGYGTNNIISYDAEQLRIKLLGRTSDGATIVCVGDVMYMISAVFESNGDEVSVIGQSDLKEQYVAKMTEVYGEPSNHENMEKEIQEQKMYYETWYWDAKTSDGKDTQIQFGTSSAIPGGEPAYISLGVVWLMDEVMQEDESVEEE